MKRSVLALLFLWASFGASAGAVFSITEIRSDTQFQGAELGLSLGIIEVTGGIDGFYLNLTATDTAQLLGDDDMRASVTGMVMIPHVGIKLNFGTRNSYPFVRGSYFRIIPSLNASLEVNYEETIPDELLDDVDAYLEKLGVSGGKIAVGAAYKFNDYVGISGEAGGRFFFHNVDLYEDPHSEFPKKFNIGAVIGTTYTALSLNFYF